MALSRFGFSHNAILVSRMHLATMALLCKQTTDNCQTGYPPEPRWRHLSGNRILFVPHCNEQILTAASKLSISPRLSKSILKLSLSLLLLIIGLCMLSFIFNTNIWKLHVGTGINFSHFAFSMFCISLCIMGSLLCSFHRFYLPHGITVDDKGNIWLTDVAMHQVILIFKTMSTRIEHYFRIFKVSSSVTLSSLLII